MDAKNRVTIPAKWLAQEGEEFQAVLNTKNGFITVMPPSTFADFANLLMEATTLSVADRRLAVKEFYSSAYTVSADKQGRVLLPEDQCQKAGLGGEIVLVGIGNRFEIWNPEKRIESSTKSRALLEKASEDLGL